MDANNDLLSLFQQTAGTAHNDSRGLTETSTINIVRKIDQLLGLTQEQNSILRSMQRGSSTMGGGRDNSGSKWLSSNKQSQQRQGGLRSTAGSGFQSGAGTGWLQQKGLLPVAGSETGRYAPGSLPHGTSFGSYELHNQKRRADRAAFSNKMGQIGKNIGELPGRATQNIFGYGTPEFRNKKENFQKWKDNGGVSGSIGRAASKIGNSTKDFLFEGVPGFGKKDKEQDTSGAVGGLLGGGLGGNLSGDNSSKQYKDNAAPVWVVGGTLNDSDELDSNGLADTSQRTPEVKTDVIIGKVIGQVTGKIGMAIGGPVGMVVGKVVGHAVGGLVSDLKSTVGEMKQSVSNIMSGFSRGAEKEMRKQYKALADQRLAADVKAIIEKPFQIMEEAAQAVKSVWEGNLREVGQAQGYTKDAMLDMMSKMSARLEKDGLSRILDATELTSNLAGVISSGLTGVVAEEFTYLATVLKATTGEDFFQYADTFGSIVAQELTKGRSQSEAIATASASLQSTAGMFMAAGRELTQGIGTGLKDMKSILDSANQIARNARVSDNTEILEALTKVSAVAGAIDSRLSTGLIEAITQATSGSNDAAIVAFRALAGQGAEATEFLRSFSQDPSRLLGTIFDELAQRQRIAPDAYMTVADQLAPVFNIPPDAFSGIDFSMMGEAMRGGLNGDRTFQQSLDLLKSGETTINSAQARMAEINKQIADDGLGWLIDNDVAMMMYKNQLDEQRQRDAQAATWAVEIKGETNNLLQSLKEGVSSILKFLNPLGSIVAFFKKANEVSKVDKNREAVLKAGVVGNPANFMYANIMTAGKALDLKISQDYASMISDGAIRGSRINAPNMQRGSDRLFNSYGATSWNNLRQALTPTIVSAVGTGFGRSMYDWKNVLGGGSGLRAASGHSGGANKNPNLTNLSASEDATERAAQRAEKVLEQVEKDAKKFVGTYEEFTAQQKQLGRNIEQLSKQAGQSEQAIVDAFNEGQVEQGAAMNAVRLQTEERWWKEMLHETQRVHSAIVAGTIIQSKALGYQENLEFTMNEFEEKKTESIFQRMFGTFRGVIQNVFKASEVEQPEMFEERMLTALAEEMETRETWELAGKRRHWSGSGSENGEIVTELEKSDRSQKAVLEDIEEHLRLHRVSFGVDGENKDYRDQFHKYRENFGINSPSGDDNWRTEFWRYHGSFGRDTLFGHANYRSQFDEFSTSFGKVGSQNNYRHQFQRYSEEWFGDASNRAGSYREQFKTYSEQYFGVSESTTGSYRSEFRAYRDEFARYHSDFNRFAIQNLQQISSIRDEFGEVFNVKGQGREANGSGFTQGLGPNGEFINGNNPAYRALAAGEHAIHDVSLSLEQLVTMLSDQAKANNTANPVEQTNILLATLVKLMGNLAQTLSGGYGGVGDSGNFWDMLSAASYGQPQ